MTKRSRLGLAVSGAIACLVNIANATAVIDHPPHNFGGPASDTEFLLPPAPGVFWQRLADDFVLSAATTIRRVNFWGFYNDDNPPVSETMRIRFYAVQSADGLPDENQTLFEQSVLNPSRTWTGRLIGDGVIPREYLYSVELAQPLHLGGGTTYWLEAVQIGDVSTRFRWEYTLADQNGHAFINNAGAPDWRNTLPHSGASLAFQLSTVPEPATLSMLLLFGSFLLTRRTWARRRSGRGRMS